MKQFIMAQFMRKLAKKVEAELPKGMGFMILVFPFNEPGTANYISNAQRHTMIKALREKADILEQKLDQPIPEEN